jgi:hypothetical protein
MNVRIAVTILAAALAAPVLAHEGGHDTAAAPQMSADDMAMMQAWEKASTPGKEHASLAQLEGSFDAAVSSWMKPGAPVEKSTGRSENRMILGGRHLEGRFTGSFMGAPFEGISYTSYDNVQKQYVSTWLDSMSTGVMTSQGAASDDGKTMTLSGECHDPLTGKATKNKQIVTIDGPNRHRIEMWGTDPKTGETWKAMEIVYTRTGSAQNAD